MLRDRGKIMLYGADAAVCRSLRGAGGRARGHGIRAGDARGPANAVVPGELVVEPPTLINLGFEWFIDGDDNRNASVAVSFRKQGETAWSPALPLLRLHGERIYSESRVDVVAPNMFAGSILDLEPDTAYEARFVMTDPDGVRGDARARRSSVRTRPEPMPSARRPRVPRLSARLQGARRSSRRSKG